MIRHLSKFKKFYSFIVLSILMIVFSFFITIKEVGIITRLDNLTHDMFFRINAYFNHNIKGDSRIAIVDIDEKSLASLGQWPWDRDILACLVYKLNSASVVGFDIYFAESDKRGEITKKMNDMEFNSLNIPKYHFCQRTQDTDKAFAMALSKTNSILAYAINLGSYINDTEKKLAPLSNQSIAEDNIDYSLLEHGKNITASIEELSDNAYANGFVNSYSHLDNVIRNAFMMIYYDDGEFKQLLPSLSLAMYAKYLGIDDIKAIGDNFKDIHLVLGDKDSFVVNAHALLGLYFKGKSPHYDYISAIDVLDGTISKEFFKDKIVLIGTSVVGLNDIRSNPLDENLPGVEIHANAIDNLLNDEYLTTPKYSSEILLISLLIIIALSVSFMYFKSIILQVLWHLILLATIILGHYYFIISKKYLLHTFELILVLAIMGVIGILINFFLESRQKEFIKAKLEKKVSKRVAEQLINTDSNVFSTSKREISVFFSDIRDFTTISENMDASDLVNFLNKYMTPMSDIIFKYNGTVDKYIGDAVMAYFNAPNDLENHADCALQAAIEQIKALKLLNEDWGKKGLPYINIGIGINTGECIVGEMGSLSRSDYTCIGDGVNTASRVESSCKNYKANILISHNTLAALKDASIYELELVDELKLKGKDEATKLYKCSGFKGEKLTLWRE
ncbi:CHASE2 domain-containing protein [Campylobacter sp. RM12647]|uniref:CHASE2 domain-containing protein n=1 Tax=Campylobacter sp. RM12647 TaxID=2735737 RepID=UPI001D2A5C78|nr:adenylate/guanylate cyclase domain-containing protein [Campylobacter sp. RM12647]